MKKYCPVCFREITTNVNGKICRHGFKKNRWVLIDNPGDNLKEVWIKVDGSPCRGSGKIGLTLIQLQKEKKVRAL